MKTKVEAFDYPAISAQPQYKAEADKLARFTVQQGEAQKRLEQLQEAARKASARQTDDQSLITEAEAFIAGDRTGTLAEQIAEAKHEAELLTKAVAAQRGVLTETGRTLSRAAGAHFMERHKAAVKRLANAITELHEANRAEADVRESLVQLGYVSHTGLLPMVYMDASDPSDTCGSVAYYWMKEARDYLMTPEERQRATNSARLRELV